MKHFNWDCECSSCLKMKAADDMYEALKEITTWMEGESEAPRFAFGSLYQSAEKALAKAVK